MAWSDKLRALPPRPLVGIVVANIIPLLGVLFLGWDLALILLLFWLENLVVGFYSIIKMAIIARWGALVLVPFFIVHFGGFTLVHLVFVLVLFVGGLEEIGDFARAHAPAALLVWAVLMVSHGVSFRDNFLRRERDILIPTAPMGSAYKRVMVLHFTIILGAWPVLVLGEPLWALALLTILKLPLDLGAHVFEHRSGGGGPCSMARPPFGRVPLRIHASMLRRIPIRRQHFQPI